MLLALDTETTGLTWDDSAFLMSYADHGSSGVFELPDQAEEIKKLLHWGERDIFIFHNAKFDLRMLIKAGVLRREDIKFDSFHDTQILAQLIDENRSLKLKDLAESVLGLTTDEATALKAAKRKYKVTGANKGRYDWLPRELLIPYAIKDAEFTLGLYHALHLPESCKPLYDRERQLVLDVLDMESNGLGVDREYAESMRKELNVVILFGLNEITRMVGIEDFNPGSTMQLAEALEARGLKLPKTDKGNPKTDSATLIALDDALARNVLEYRKNTKLLNTYILPMLEEGKSGVLHPNFNVGGTKTGRFSSSKARE